MEQPGTIAGGDDIPVDGSASLPPALPPEPSGAFDLDEQEIHLLLLAGRLLLEHSEATVRVERTLYELAANLGREIRLSAGYRDLTLYLRCGDHFEGRVSRFTAEHKVNMRMITHVHDRLRRLSQREASLPQTISALERLEKQPPKGNRWVAALAIAAAAASLAGIFGGDASCAAVSAVSAGLGAVLRQELGRRHFNMFFLPFSAALLGAVLGGLAGRAGWTATPDLCAMVPSLVLVPGVHLLNAAYDLFENFMPLALSRAALCLSILGAIAFGLLLGAGATGTLLPVSSPPASIPLPIALAFAATASAGFGLFFNVPLRLMWACILFGVAGHAARDVAIGMGLDLAWSTLLASTLVGVLTAALRERRSAPFAAVAFGAVVPLVPGALIMRTASGIVQLMAAGATAPPPFLVETVVAGLQAAAVLLAITVGLLMPVALVRRTPRRPTPPPPAL